MRARARDDPRGAVVRVIDEQEQARGPRLLAARERFYVERVAKRGEGGCVKTAQTGREEVEGVSQRARRVARVLVSLR